MLCNEPFSCKMLKSLILERVKIMLLAFGNMFSSKITFCCEGFCSPRAGILWQSFPFKWFQPTSLLSPSWERAASHLCILLPGCSARGLPGWFRVLRSQHAFRSHIFSFCVFRDYMNPYFSVSHASSYASLSPSLTAEVSCLHQKYLPAPSEQMPSLIPSLANTCSVLESGFYHGLLQLCS